MTAGFEEKPLHLRALVWKSALWMTTLVATLALSGARALAGGVGYVANAEDGTVSVINTSTNTVTATIQTNGAVAVAVTPDGTRAYVLTNDGVSVIDTATNAVVGSPIPVGSDVLEPVGIAVTPNGASVYVTNSNDRTVSVISTASNTVVDTISVGTNPSGIAITPDEPAPM
jgi:YVTN family beta-propeller protein